MARSSLRLQASADRYLTRRLERSLIRGVDSDSLPPPSLSLTFGLGLTAIILAGCTVLSLLRPAQRLGDEPIVMERRSGALFVQVDGVVHPVLNLTSAQLITQRRDDPRPVAESALAKARRGVLLGIPGAPQMLGMALPEPDSHWTVCEGARTTVIAGPVAAGAGTARLSEDDAALVSGPTGTAYLLHSGHRSAVDPANPAIKRALRLDGVEPRAVSSVFLNTVPEAVPLTVPRIPGAGGPAPHALAGFRVGDIVRIERVGAPEYYVVLTGGVQPVGAVAADLIRFAGADSGAAIPAVSAAAISEIPTTGVLPVDTFPDRIAAPRYQDAGQLCATWIDGAVTFSVGAGLPIAAGEGPVALAGADGTGPSVDDVYVPPGRSVYARPQGGAPHTGSVVTDTGVRFPVGDADTARLLGMPDAAVPAPWALLSALPEGPELSRHAALVAHDVVAVTTPTRDRQDR